MVKVRAYEPTDYDGLIMLYRNRQAYGGHFDASRDTPERLLATSKLGNLFVACDGKKVIGTCMMLENPHSCWMIRFAVKPELKNNQAVAALLFERVNETAVARGHESVIVYTDTEDTALNQRYAKLGFHQSGDYRSYWKETTA